MSTECLSVFLPFMTSISSTSSAETGSTAASRVLHKGHAAIWNRLMNDLSRNELAPAMLFVGPEHLGKTTLALDLAVQIQCAAFSSSEEADQAEKLLRKGLDPDTLLLLKTSDEDNSLPIEAIRQVLRRTSEGKHGQALVVVIEDLSRIKIETLNLLLKTLEEPHPQVFFILTARSEVEVLPTIRSRSRLFRFDPLEESQLRELGTCFVNQFLASKQDAMAAGETVRSPDLETACRLSVGRPGLLARLIQDEPLLNAFLQIEKDLDGLFSSPSRAAVFDLVKTYEASPFLSALLDRALVLARRWLLNPLDAPASLPQLDAPQRKVEWCRAILEAQADLDANVNARLTLERLFLSIF